MKYCYKGNILQYILFLVFSVLFSSISRAQTPVFPVNVTPQIIPPYSLKLSEYSTSSSEKLFLNLLLTDITESNRQVRLKFFLENNAGLSVQSSDVVIGASPIFLDGGVPLRLSNLDLRPYFELQNLRGINPRQYSVPLKEGLYKFCFEVYDALSNRQISRKSCTAVYLVLNDPPFLNTPRRGEQVLLRNPQNIVFDWTPRHLNATNVEYEFTISELWDTQMDPQAGFLASRPLYQTTTRATTLLYGPAEPQLLNDKMYGWRVRAIVRDGISETSVFKNDGFSEINHFTYTGSCAEPAYVLAEAKNPTAEKIMWQGVDHIRYNVEYRKKDAESSIWFEGGTINEYSNIYNLEPGTTYEFRVGGQCLDNGPFTYSQIYEFTTTLADDEETSYNCGITPEIVINNQDPLEFMGANETFTAGDFPVTVREVNGRDGTFSGWGFIVVPYLQDTKIKVSFEDVKINTEYQLIEGIVVTDYDEDWGGVDNIQDEIDVVTDLVDALDTLGIEDGDYIEETVDFEIEEIVQNNNGETVIIGTNGEEHVVPQGENVVVRDENGNIVAVNEEGENIEVPNEEEGDTGEEGIDEDEEIKDTPYYVEIKDRTEKYKYNERLYFVRQKSQATLFIKSEDEEVSFSKPVWKYEDEELGKGESISIDLKELGEKTIRLTDEDDENKEFKFKLKVYDKPIIIFKKKSSFSGTYGHDEAKFSELQKKNDYKEISDKLFHKKFAIEKKEKYFVHYLTLVSGMFVELDIDKKYLKSEMSKDPSFSLKFKSSTPKLNLNFEGQESILDYNSLNQTPILFIQSDTQGTNASFADPYEIVVKDQAGEMVGKIMVVSGDIKSTKKEIVLVKVKHDTDLPVYDLSNQLNLLDLKAYNQAFSNWTNIVSETIDISATYSTKPEYYKGSSTSLARFKTEYEKNKTIDNNKFYVFVSDIRIEKTDDDGNRGYVAGVAGAIGSQYMALFKDRGSKTIIHELGHCLGLNHSFSSSVGSRKIEKKTTENFMDYSSKRNMFFIYQLKELFNL